MTLHTPVAAYGMYVFLVNVFLVVFLVPQESAMYKI